ncbi:MAG: 30S ribosomal protein S20 [Candidatus Brocadiaceae bacterium]|nr:30S ribosomal protein S20 [Candidatus Brocadiaceae bacterium]
MPHRASAKKRLRQDQKRRFRNKSVKSRLRTEENKLNRMVERGDVEAAAVQSRLLTKLLQQAAAGGVVHANRVARKQGQIDRCLDTLAKPRAS